MKVRWRRDPGRGADGKVRIQRGTGTGGVGLLPVGTTEVGPLATIGPGPPIRGASDPKMESPEPEATAALGREIAVPGSGALSDVDLERGIRLPYGALNHLAMISTFVFVAPPR